MTREGPLEPRGHPMQNTANANLRAHDWRATLSTLLLLVDVVVLVMTIGGIDGPLRFVFGLVFGVVVPGWSIVGLLNLENAALETGLAIAVSLSLLMMIAQLLMTVHLWHLGALEIGTCLACLPSLVRQSRRHRTDPRNSS